MKKYVLLILLTSCHNQFIIEKPKIQPAAVVNPTFEGYALAFKIKWDIVSK